MRAAVWILRPSVPAARVEELVAGLASRGVAAASREIPGGLALVVADAPEDLAVPPEVARTASVDTPSDAAITRRTLLDAFAAAVAVAAAGAGTGVAAAFVTGSAGRPEDVGEMEATTLSALRAQGAVRFRFGREPAIAVLSGGHVFALSLVCTHLGCLVAWRPELRRLVCPCHKAAFDLEGAVLQGPPPRPLTTFHTELRGDRVLVRRRADE
jgi:cytochrome b6-f complex iron-sulfur subunit